MKNRGVMLRVTLAGMALTMLTGAAAAQSSEQRMRERAATEPQTGSGGKASEGTARAAGNAPYNNQVQKLTNPLGANGK